MDPSEINNKCMNCLKVILTEVTMTIYEAIFLRPISETGKIYKQYKKKIYEEFRSSKHPKQTRDAQE